MSGIVYNGNTGYSFKINGVTPDVYYNGIKIWPTGPNYNPLGLPANTIRVKFKPGFTPTMGDSRTLVDGSNNIWDIYKASNNWSLLLQTPSTGYGYRYNVLQILGANTTNVTSFNNLCNSEAGLTATEVFDTHNATDLAAMFYSCTGLQGIPLFPTNNATKVDSMFCYCYNVNSGALDIYNQMTAQANPPTAHSQTFTNCGSNTVNGAAELAQIPNTWK